MSLVLVVASFAANALGLWWGDCSETHRSSCTLRIMHGPIVVICSRTSVRQPERAAATCCPVNLPPLVSAAAAATAASKIGVLLLGGRPLCVPASSCVIISVITTTGRTKYNPEWLFVTVCDFLDDEGGMQKSVSEPENVLCGWCHHHHDNNENLFEVWRLWFPLSNVPLIKQPRLGRNSRIRVRVGCVFFQTV